MYDFATRYKSYTNSQLHTVLDNAHQYVPEALDAAEQELKNRGLDASADRSTRKEEATSEHNDQKSASLKALENVLFLPLDLLHPNSTKYKLPMRILLAIGLGVCLISIYRGLNEL